MHKVNLKEKFAMFSDHWSPKLVGSVGDMHIKLAKIKGQFLWHSHENEDEMFYVVNGALTIRFKDRDEHLIPGEFIIIPKGVEHMPVAEEEVQIMLIEPASTLNTGNELNERTVIPKSI